MWCGLSPCLPILLVWHRSICWRCFSGVEPSQALPLRWKKDKLNLPLLQNVVETQYGYRVHPTLPMTYDSSRLALKDLGEDGEFEDNLGHYTSNIGLQMKPIVSIAACNPIVLHRTSVILMGMGALDELLDLPNLFGTGHFTSQETLFLKSITKRNLSSEISNMWRSRAIWIYIGRLSDEILTWGKKGKRQACRQRAI